MTGIDEGSYWEAHQGFLKTMKSKNGDDFTGFSHSALVEEEIAYKYVAQRDGRAALDLARWGNWIRTPGRILRATRSATARQVSANLLEHRFGARGDSDSPLHRVTTGKEIAELELELNELLRGGATHPEEYGPRFDRFAEFLRERHLGCKWPFLAYLSFLMEPRRYFPVLPGRFGALLKFYRVDSAFAGRVEWARYHVLLEVAAELRERLSVQYGSTPSTVEIQSYMWVVGGLLEDGHVLAGEPTSMPLDSLHDLASRQRRAANRERTGYLGEELVVSLEKDNLMQAGRQDLADQVAHVARTSDEYGYDVLSFTETGAERHIEVKTTQRDRSNDRGFFLSAHEYATAQSDPDWCVIRVWSIGRTADYEELGNVVVAEDSQWKIDPASWLVRPRR